jgi:hypothetical protein
MQSTFAISSEDQQEVIGHPTTNPYSPQFISILRMIFFWVAGTLLLSGATFLAAQAEGIPSVCSDKSLSVSQNLIHANSFSLKEGGRCLRSTDVTSPGITSPEPLPQLVVVGFMGGRVKGDNFVHREALLARELREGFPGRVSAAVFANHDAQNALKTVLHQLDTDRDGHLSANEKSTARIVIYGHSWGASETVAFARRLNELNIPVLLTIQVDSVQKPNENDGDIPPNVREAVNFYQVEGLLHGRSLIEAMDPKQTTILGNYESSYKKTPISCANYPWFARTFMRPHIEIENDPSVWEKIAALIRTKVI